MARNSADPATRPSVEKLLHDPSALVRAMAVWALRKIAPADAFATLRKRHAAAETDDAVRDEWNGEAA